MNTSHLRRLRAENRTLRNWLQSETSWANHYHAEGLALRRELDEARDDCERLTAIAQGIIAERDEELQRFKEVTV